MPPGPLTECLVACRHLMGGENVLDRLRSVSPASAEVRWRHFGTQRSCNAGTRPCPDLTLRFDLAELAGYGYHNGPVFSAYHADVGQALARGGRYDGIGEDSAGSRRRRASTSV